MSILEKFRGIYGSALNLDLSPVSGHLINLLRDPSIQGGASSAGILRAHELPPWVGSRIKTTGTPPDSSETSLETPLTSEKPGVDPLNIQKSPAYRAPNSEVPQDQTETPNSGGVDPVRESATPLRLLSQEARYPSRKSST